MSTIQVFDPEKSPLSGLMLLEASAGTGKTYALERMVTRLIGREESPLTVEEILVVTFTNKAAREMKERIRKLLAERAAEKARTPDERRRYRTALSGFDSAPIYTIHGFCKMALSTWPFESASPFRQEIKGGGQLESAELRSWIAGMEARQVNTDLMRSAYHQYGGMENLIGGITRELLNDGYPPGAQVLPSIEDSRKFADLMAASLLPGSPLGKAAGNVFTRNWSSAAMAEVVKAAFNKTKTAPSLVKISSHMEGCRNSSGLLSLTESMFTDPSNSGGSEHFVELFAAALKIGITGSPVPAMSAEAGDLVRAFTDLFRLLELCMDFNPQGEKPLTSLVKPYMRCAFSDIARKSVEDRVEKLKEITGSWGYADLIRRVSKTVANPESPLLPVLRKRFKAALIDEFQDTDPRQWDMFRSIFTGTGESHILALIGDPKQCIYGFRGTGLQAYNAARNLVPQDSVYRLDTNYRSTPSLVAAANFLFEPLFRSASDGNPVGFEPVRPGRTVRKPAAAGPGPAVTFLDVESKNDASGAIVAAVRQLLEPGTQQVGSSDIAVLVRGEDEENDIFSRLKAAGIPAVRFRTRSVFTSPQVSSLDVLLRAMDRPREISFWKSVLAGRYFSIPPAMILRFEESGYLDGFVEEGLEWQRLFTAGRSMEAFDAFFRYGVHTADWAESAGDTALASRLRTPWPGRVLSEPDGLRQWQDWRHLCELIQNRQAAGITDIHGIRSWLADSASDPDPESSGAAVRLETEAPAVRVMTMHSAKGLEFPLVFLHGGYRGKTPRKSFAEHRFDNRGTLAVDRLGRESTFRRHLAYEWEEDKRLWYVSFTRASERIWIPLVNDGHLTLTESLLHQVFLPPDVPDSVSGAAEPMLPPHQLLTSKNAGEIKAAVRERLRDLAVSRPEQFAFAEGPVELLPPLPPETRPEGKTAPPPGGRLSLRDPFTGSYTSLVRSAGIETREQSREADDRDTDGHTGPVMTAPIAGADPIQTSPDREPLLLSADRGALFGTLVHSFFEECDFRKAGACSEEDWIADPEIEELFTKLTRRCYPPGWYRPRARALKSMVFATLSANVDGLGRLCDIPEDRKRAEVEFLMSIPRDGTLDAGELRLASRRGFLKGYIDLLVEHGGRWWVVDWKTNVPPGRETAEAYDPSCLDEIMGYHHYHLQYELYLLALCRTLSANGDKPVDWDSQIGGAAYLFVRGTRSGDNRGVFTRKPSLKRMHELASAMGLQGVIR